MSRRTAIYLDSNSGAPLSQKAKEALLSFLSDPLISNPSSIHSLGQKARRSLSDAREKIALSIGASSDPERVLLTSSGTESNQWAIRSELEPRIARGEKAHWITSRVEHDSVLKMVDWAKSVGVDVSLLPVDSRGVADPAALEELLRPDTALVSLLWVNNETGVVQDVPEFAKRLSSRGIAFHVDGAQVWGKLPIQAEKLGIRWLSLSGHKIGGPAGTGVLWMGRGARPLDWIRGSQEKGRRGGTENLLGTVGLGAAASGISPDLWSERVEKLRDRLESAICDRIPGARIQGQGAPRVANTLNLRFEGTSGEGLVLALDLEGYCVSAGAACSSGALEPSHVLQAMGLSPSEARSAIRISLADEMPWEQLEGFVEALESVVARMRKKQ